MKTGFFWDERCFWHGGGNYSFMLPAGGLVQPGGGLPESPETKRRFKNLLDVTGLMKELETRSAPAVNFDDLLRVHPRDFIDLFKSTAEAGGGELGLRAPFGPDGFDIACISAGLAKTALDDVLDGRLKNAYALSRPPGHHCTAEWQNGFCLLANIAIAVEAALAAQKAERIVVLDWDVHHGNGTEAIFYDRPDVLTISIHQEHNYPLNTGDFADRGDGPGTGFNLNIPLPPGTGHKGYLAALDRLVTPQIQAFNPDAIVIACGFDASAFDPLGRMLASAETFQAMTQSVMALANDLCDGKLVMVHEGGYSEAYVPFCGHAVVAEMADSAIQAPDAFQDALRQRQPGASFDTWLHDQIDEMTKALNT